MDFVLDIISAMLLAAGTFFVFVGGVGVMRMPDFYTRMHAASLTDTGGAALIIAGLLLQGGLTLAPVKLLAIFLFLFLTSPPLMSKRPPAPKPQPDEKQAKPAAKKKAASKTAAKKTPAKKPAAKKKAAKKS